MLHPGSRLPGMRCTSGKGKRGFGPGCRAFAPAEFLLFGGGASVPSCSGSADGTAAGLRDGCILLGMPHDCGSITCRKGAAAQGLREYANIACRTRAQPRGGHGDAEASHAAGAQPRGGHGNTQISHAARAQPRGDHGDAEASHAARALHICGMPRRLNSPMSLCLSFGICLWYPAFLSRFLPFRSPVSLFFRLSLRQDGGVHPRRGQCRGECSKRAFPPRLPHAADPACFYR